MGLSNTMKGWSLYLLDLTDRVMVKQLWGAGVDCFCCSDTSTHNTTQHSAQTVSDRCIRLKRQAVSAAPYRRDCIVLSLQYFDESNTHCTLHGHLSEIFTCHESNFRTIAGFFTKNSKCALHHTCYL